MKPDAISVRSALPGVKSPAITQTTEPARIQAFLPGYLTLSQLDLREDVFIAPDRYPVTSTRRLVVIVPHGEFDANALIRRTWQLAASSGLSVLYLTTRPDDLFQPYQSARLSELASMTSGKEVHARSSVSSKRNWLDALGSVLRPGDLLVSLSGHQRFNPIFLQKEIGAWLARATDRPVYILGGIKVRPSFQYLQKFKTILAWITSLALLATFFLIQITISRLLSGSFSTILLYLTILTEVFLLYKVNEWIN